MGLHHPVRIGGYITKGNIFLAPVAGYSDAAYRSVCLDAGCDLAYTEMVSSEALIRDSVKTEVLLQRAANETENAVQLFGANPEVMARAAALVADRWHPSVIDINSGCPVPKIVRNGAGSALMRDLPRLCAIVEAMSAATAIPVTVKIRLGWDDDSINYLEVAERTVAAGAKAVTLHARTRHQAYSGQAERAAFGRLAAAVPVPVFASGDIFTPADALAILGDSTPGAGRVAGIMVARGAMGNPFVFSRIKAALEGSAEPVIDSALRLATARHHFRLSLEFYDQHTAGVEFRKQACSYLKGVPHGAELRNLAVRCATPAEYEIFFERWKESLPSVADAAEPAED
ncbi:MAG TPA: tRNA dihydrouridine synthase DusB [Spirochaetaceae bacterium]|nr:tRNA dihydrouridine synthase DusB [Spirochaetaceae bacterium]HBO40250.1 tRNA dihydrouridine synthase DusB [Spirochaetaceae bacterium]HCQ85900.1 tRNA dihydrouridine synthase DusB [Spirochaetaceae bacterium]